jgi:hypothetical protein
MVAYVARKKEKPLDPRMKVSEKDGVAKVAPDHPDPAVGHMLLMGALGTIDTDFLDGLLREPKGERWTKGDSISCSPL